MSDVKSFLETVHSNSALTPCVRNATSSEELAAVAAAGFGIPVPAFAAGVRTAGFGQFSEAELASVAGRLRSTISTTNGTQAGVTKYCRTSRTSSGAKP